MPSQRPSRPSSTTLRYISVGNPADEGSEGKEPPSREARRDTESSGDKELPSVYLTLYVVSENTIRSRVVFHPSMALLRSKL